MPTGFMSGYAQRFQCHPSCFLPVPEKSPALLSLCATTVVLCAAAGFYVGKLAHGFYLLIIRIQTHVHVWEVTSFLFFFFFSLQGLQVDEIGIAEFYRGSAKIKL